MLFETNKDKGRAGMVTGIAYFGSNGYTINIPLNDTQWYDFVIEKDGRFQTVQCKATSSKDNAIDLRSISGTSRKTCYNIIDKPIDILFCIDEQKNIYVIPVEDMRAFGCYRSIKLRTKPTKNHQGFQTYKYLVKL